MRQRVHLFILIAVVAGMAPAFATTHIEFLGQRFVPRLTNMDSFGGVGFDPIGRRVLSVNLRGVCGNAQMSTQTSDNGVAWDPVGEEFWFIGNDREVYRYVAGVKDVIFTIPENFTVPGVGPATLDRPEGLAIDMNHVYVVDAGSSGQRGELLANEWFKFARDGTPVSSSAVTDFTTALQPHFDAGGDCVVDGLAWVPPDAPYGQGLFLMAIEHSGIQVLDEDGMFVARILWQDQGIIPGAVPFGFAGLTMDPLTGNLYLVENGGKLHVWERLADQGPLTHIYGVGGPKLHSPASDCDWPLLSDYGGTLGFSLTYRDADGLLWTNDFSSGEVFTMDPLYPFPQSKGVLSVVNVWGMAYDDERDVIYLFRETDSTLHELDPETLDVTFIAFVPFVRELAFNSIDKHIYGRGTANGQDVLVRLDRDDGFATIVGPTAQVYGMTFDKGAGMLVGIGGGKLYHINPSTGQAQVLATGLVGGWEGLAAVPVGAPAAAAVRTTMPATFALRAYPNPLPREGHIAFDMPQYGHVRAGVFDLAGRRVAELYDGMLGAGPQSLFWNARDRAGRQVASGIYYVRVEAPEVRGVTKVTVVR